MPKRIAKKREGSEILKLPLTMEQCKRVRKRLNRDIAKLTIEEKKDLNNYVREHEERAKKTSKELQPGMRLSLIAYWFIRKEKKV